MIRALLTIGLLLASAHGAAAQERACTTEEAAAQFGAAREAEARGDTPTALERFEWVLECAPNPAAAFNTAILRCRSGAILDGIALLEALVAEEYGPISDAQRAEVATRTTACRADLATLDVRAPAGMEVALDERSPEPVGAGGALVMTVDPGRHTLIAAGHGCVAPAHVALERGESRVVILDTRRCEEASTSDEPAPAPARGGDDALAIGLGVGAGVLAAVAVAIVLGVVLGGGDDVCDPAGCVSALTSAPPASPLTLRF